MLESLAPSYGHVVQLLLDYRYLIIVPLAVIEGPILALICGALIKANFLSFWPIYVCLMIGDLVSDIYWYYIGYHGGHRLTNRFAKYFSVTDEHLTTVKNLYNKHYFLILLLSKLTMGLGFAVAIVAAAGYARIPFKKYMIANIIGQPIWTCALIAVGYFLGTYITTFQHTLDYVGFGVGVLIVIALFYGLTRYIRAKLVEKYL